MTNEEYSKAIMDLTIEFFREVDSPETQKRLFARFGIAQKAQLAILAYIMENHVSDPNVLSFVKSMKVDYNTALDIMLRKRNVPGEECVTGDPGHLRGDLLGRVLSYVGGAKAEGKEDHVIAQESISAITFCLATQIALVSSSSEVADHLAKGVGPVIHMTAMRLQADKTDFFSGATPESGPDTSDRTLN